jgi:hypothetical protein
MQRGLAIASDVGLVAARTGCYGIAMTETVKYLSWTFAACLIAAPHSVARAKDARASESTATETVDPRWLGFLDRDVVLTLKNGAALVGHMMGVEPEGVTLRISAISTRKIPLSEISTVRMSGEEPTAAPSPSPPPPPAYSEDDGDEPRSGRGLMIGGGAVLAVGVVWLAAGLGVMLGDTCVRQQLPDPGYYGDVWTGYSYYDGGCKNAGIAVSSAGVIQLAAGIPMIVVGSTWKKRWSAWQERHVKIRPSLRVTGRSWGVGLRIAF